MAFSLVDMQMQQRQMTRWKVVLWSYLLMSLMFLNTEQGVNALTLRRDAGTNPQDEYITSVKEGETLTMTCYVTRSYLRNVWWGKWYGSDRVWLTEDSTVLTHDPRVSISKNLYIYNHDYYIFSIQITDITASDSGTYNCYTEWDGYYTETIYSAYGLIIVSVNYFPNENPICSTNKTDTSSMSDSAVLCDTMQGNPEVTITWFIERTGEVVPAGRMYYYTRMGQGRLWRVLELRQQLQHDVLVCIVTSSGFPALSRSCFIGPFVEFSSTTEILKTTTPFDTTSPLETTGAPSSHAIASTDKLKTNHPAEITSHRSTAQPVNTSEATTPTSVASGISDNTGLPSNAGTISAVVAILSLFIVLSVILLCILKRRRRETDVTDKGKLNRTTVLVETRYDPDAAREEGQTKLGNGDNGATGPEESAYETSFTNGEKSNNFPCEVELDPACHSVSYAQIPERYVVGHSSCVQYETVHRDDSDCGSVSRQSQEGDNLYEHVNSSSITWDKGQSGTYAIPGGDIGELESGVAGSLSDESDEGMVDNPIYQSYDEQSSI